MRGGTELKQKKSIRRALLTIGILPIVILGVVIFAVGVYSIYNMYSGAIRDELASSTYVLKGCLDMAVQGDYTYNDELMKGNVNISASSMLDEIKQNSDIDTTIFWGDTRILTTIEGADGVSTVGTKADSRIAEKVVHQGESYFTNDLQIGERDYIGYYTPLSNEDGTIVGMVFAGKPKAVFYRNIRLLMIFFALITVSIIMIAVFVWRRFSKSLIQDINLIKSYLHNIADGDLTATMDEQIEQREDEIGEIGIYAKKMCDALKAMIELDPLTLLYNRRTGNCKIQKLIENRKPFTVVMGDIDLFKHINDQYGHDCGDEVLKSVSAILKKSVQDCGFASRWGGEEFLLIYELDLEQTRIRVEELAKEIQNHTLCYDGLDVKVTMTIGVKEMDYAFSYEKIIRHADDNLYEGKRNGRNQIVYE